MSYMSPHWEVPISATSIYAGILVAAVTTIAIRVIIFRKPWKGSEKVASITLFQGSSNFQISETNAALILNSDGQFTKIQRNLICDCIVNLPEINSNLKEHVLAESITALPCAKAVFKDYQNKKKSGPCFKGTRLALLREMADCVTGSSESRMYILSGIAGIGKSTVAYTIASRAAELNLLGASFFFSRDEADCNNAQRFFTTIAYQLCVYNEIFSKAIGDVLKTDGRTAATMKDPQYQLQVLILDPLRSIVQSSCFRPILIVVDALDECDEEDAFSVLTGLSQLIRDLPPFRVILTKRPLPYLDRFCGSQDGHKFFHLQDIKDKVVDGDIRLYLNHNLSMKQVQKCYPMQQWCASDEEIGSLVCAAGSFFIIASTTVRYILSKTASNPAAQMQKLLHAFAQDHTPFEDLDHFYTVILRVVLEDCDDDNIVSRYKSLTGTIISVQHHALPVSTLAHLSGIDVEEIHAVLDKLQSVDLLDGDDVPHIYHKSFLDYLKDQSRCKDPHLRIDPRICHTKIATRCFEIMSKHLRRNILGLSDLAQFMSNEDGLREDGITDEQLQEKIPQQLSYACAYWANHFEVATIKDEALMDGLERFADEHMLYWLEVLSLIGKLDSAHRAIGVVLKLLATHTSTSDLHQLLSDALRFISKFYEIIKQSALHTYYSALSFTPTDSLLYRRYNKEAEHNICTIEGGPEKWDDLIAVLSHGNRVGVVKFSPDSTLLLSCSSAFERMSPKKFRLRIWDAATGTPISTVLRDQFAVANDFSTVASSQANIITLYNVNGSPSGTVFTTSSEIRKLALSSESSRVAAALSDGTVWLWDSGNAELIDSFDGIENSGWSGFWLQFSPTGTRLAYSLSCGIGLRDGVSGRFIADLQCNQLHNFKFSGDGSRFAFVHQDGLTLWNSESGALIAVGDVSWYFAISANGSLLATATKDNHKVTLWSENNDHLAQINVLELSWPISAMAFSLDNILAITTMRCIKLYNVKTDSFIHTLPLGLPTCALNFSPDCTRLAVVDLNGKVNLWDIRGIDASGPPSREATHVTALALSRDCSRLACGLGDGTVELWGTSPTKRRIASHQTHERWFTFVFGPDGELFASGSCDGTIKLWNGEDGSLRGTLKAPGTLWVVALSNSVLVGRGSNGITLWSLNTLSLIHTLTEFRYGMDTAVSIAENNALIAIAHHGGVSLLDAENHRTITTLDALDGIHAMTFLPDKLVALSRNGDFLSVNLINKHVMKGATLEHRILLPNISFWHGVPIWHCLDNDQHYFTASFPQHKSPVPLLWIPHHICAWTQGSSMVALGCWDGRIILLRLPTSHVG